MDLVRILTWQLTVNGGLPALLGTDDVHQIGAEELIDAAQRFRKEGTAQFRTYARKCIHRKMVGTIQEARFGPTAATLSRWKRLGIPRPVDIVSYDAMDTEEFTFLENVPADEQEEFIKRISPEMAAVVLKDLDRSERKKLDKRNKAGATGIVYKAHSAAKYRGRYGGWMAYLNILGKQNFIIGKFPTKEEAIDARQRFIAELREFCAEVIGTNKGALACS